MHVMHASLGKARVCAPDLETNGDFSIQILK